jgi:integrase
MKKMSLTSKRVQRLLNRPGRYRDDQVKGLLLVVTNTNSASWILRYERNNHEKWMGVGPARLVSLKDARERAKAARLQLLDGVDPLDAKRVAKAAHALEAARALTFEQAALAYFDQHQRKWGRKSRDQFLSSLKQFCFPLIGSLPVSGIDTGLVLKVLEQPHKGARLWDSIPVTAGRIRNRIESVLDWCTVRGYRSGDNPSRWRGHLQEVLPPRAKLANRNHPALPYAELPAFMSKLRAQEGVAARALEFTILTAARTGEVRGAVWDEVDPDAATWTIPAARMKAHREHRVPLPPRVVELLRGLPTTEGNPALFVSGLGGLSNLAMTRVLKRLRPEITIHGFRSSFRDWAAERTAFAPHVAELSLAHASGLASSAPTDAATCSISAAD